MACGTPVIAFPFGSMPELIEPGVNGALVESVDQAVAAVEALAALDRRLCRHSFDYPDIKVEIIIDYGLTDIVAQRCDAGVRWGEQVAKGMIAVRIAWRSSGLDRTSRRDQHRRNRRT